MAKTLGEIPNGSPTTGAPNTVAGIGGYRRRSKSGGIGSDENSLFIIAAYKEVPRVSPLKKALPVCFCAANSAYDTTRYGRLTCAQKLTRWAANLAHSTETKNKAKLAKLCTAANADVGTYLRQRLPDGSRRSVKPRKPAEAALSNRKLRQPFPWQSVAINELRPL